MAAFAKSWRLFCAGAPVFGVVSVAIHSRPPICCNFVTSEQCCLVRFV
jgi:hypothetical protein